ncbi:LysR family transcriptional regulator [Cytobacillus purgationiresistens]|uniref:DNA-binding transcriptional LysR family regulator n=1 Tax=Cytobacillus purgationiresistens TaxID=863449 RepID=A0ABU0AK60_9BACI|nr:LysR family transcriptional regulator [Cytobacillus purgationiresistens]MDQ0271662.1 DNA-binding transcriptional LysR family regulator [Cytobacillus purgationiresistens]
MNIEQLNYIVEVSKAKSLAVAAKTLNVSQSALSQAITKLESELNLKVFNRTRTGAVTTKEGDRIVEKAQNALHAIYEIKEEAHKQLNSLNDILRISAIPGLTSPIIDTYLSCKEKTPIFKLEVHEKGSMEIIHDIQNEDIDIGFIALKKENMDLVNDLLFTPVVTGKILAFVSRYSPLAENDILTADMLKQQTFVLYRDEYVQEFIAHFQRVHGPVEVFFTATSIEAILKAVIEIDAVSIGHDISAIYFPKDHIDQYQTLEIEGYTDSPFRFGWIQKKDYKLSKEASKFIQEVNNILLKQ